jgi:hypothetical protein
LAECARYFRVFAQIRTAWNISTTQASFGIDFYPPMRTTPTISAASGPFIRYGPGGQLTPTLSFSDSGPSGSVATATVASGLTLNNPSVVAATIITAAEL